MKRRRFITRSGQLVLGAGLLHLTACGPNTTAEGTEDTASESEGMDAGGDLFFKISLAQWSLHKALFAKEIDNLDFARIAREEFDIDGLEYVNQFFKDKAKDNAYLTEMKKRASDHGVQNVLIMIDGEGGLGNGDEAERMKAVENHYKWVDAANFLGCSSIRVNAYGEGSSEEVAGQAVKSLSLLGDYAAQANINVIVENHGGYSSNGQWLSGVMREVGKNNVGTLPDFGNFCIERGQNDAGERICLEEYDRYKGVKELMPYAKGVSAKTHDFGPDGMETHSDYMQLMKIVKDANYTGFVGVEYEGSGVSEMEGIRLTKELLVKVGRELS
ncbi:sugar phosphate isomerase/epimerase family protein [Flavilitoribacter nigricans]|uniref:Xylose isomerase n=1 Tax=Flavilitoribacter nigricans (strain ATCC 23147 / DSM 23189 / NBRC 102662 / NCIMB 1420 / SS-2) TaxID=1122177 RepID=A0A2D0NFK5_FLAN2|nr:sugar phosphate isomerase/epimerase family protein [Flavilitoribacter nigricans]PHN07271.1 xylose isomerase [Flavilitoribacter nigricans DSM 23189 = NBRC 102662]